MKTTESLDLAKLAETTCFGVYLAFAQEMNRYTEHVGGDYSASIDFFGRSRRVAGRDFFGYGAARILNRVTGLPEK